MKLLAEDENTCIYKTVQKYMYIIYDDHYMYLANMTKINVLWKYICTRLKLQRFKNNFKNTSIKCMSKYEYMY